MNTNDQGEWGVWCRCVGVLGERQAWLKDMQRNVKRFESEEEASAEAQRIMARLSPHGSASFSYYARRYEY